MTLNWAKISFILSGHWCRVLGFINFSIIIYIWTFHLIFKNLYNDLSFNYHTLNFILFVPLKKYIYVLDNKTVIYIIYIILIWIDIEVSEYTHMISTILIILLSELLLRKKKKNDQWQLLWWIYTPWIHGAASDGDDYFLGCFFLLHHCPDWKHGHHPAIFSRWPSPNSHVLLP